MWLAERYGGCPVIDWIKCDECDGIPADVCPSCRKQAEFSHKDGLGNWVVYCPNGCTVRLRDMPADEPDTTELCWVECCACSGQGGWVEDADGEIQESRNPKYA
jgi:hypothetical protein